MVSTYIKTKGNGKVDTAAQEATKTSNTRMAKALPTIHLYRNHLLMV